jgi:hypothetical protein
MDLAPAARRETRQGDRLGAARAGRGGAALVLGVPAVEPILPFDDVQITSP